jgi:hypothetical protein
MRAEKIARDAALAVRDLPRHVPVLLSHDVG